MTATTTTFITKILSLVDEENKIDNKTEMLTNEKVFINSLGGSKGWENTT